MSPPQPDQLPDRLRPLVERAVAGVGFDLEEIGVRQAGRRRLVRVVVDADRGVGLDDVATLSRKIAAELDEQDAVLGGPYTLEVTSPGVDRPLREPRHWRRAFQRLAEVRLRDGGTITGRIGRVRRDGGQDTVRLLAGGVARELRLADVERATVVVEFKQPPAEELRALAEEVDSPGEAVDDGET
jgi:ribosome maturation factor RimP